MLFVDAASLWPVSSNVVMSAVSSNVINTQSKLGHSSSSSHASFVSNATRVSALKEENSFLFCAETYEIR